MANEKNSKRLPGFYIALCCCVLVIGIAGYFTERQDTKPQDTNRIVSKTEIQGEVLPTASVIPEVISVNETITIEEPTPTEAPVSEPTEAPPEYSG